MIFIALALICSMETGSCTTVYGNQYVDKDTCQNHMVVSTQNDVSAITSKMKGLKKINVMCMTKQELSKFKLAVAKATDV